MIEDVRWLGSKVRKKYVKELKSISRIISYNLEKITFCKNYWPIIEKEICLKRNFLTWNLIVFSQYILLNLNKKKKRARNQSEDQQKKIVHSLNMKLLQHQTIWKVRFSHKNTIRWKRKTLNGIRILNQNHQSLLWILVMKNRTDNNRRIMELW